MHSEMGPARQNPIQRTVRTAHLSVLMTVHNFSTQYITEQFCMSADLYVLPLCFIYFRSFLTPTLTSQTAERHPVNSICFVLG